MHSAKHLAFCAIVSAAVAVPCAARPFGMVFDHASAPWNAMKDRELRAAADAVRTNAAETVTAKGVNPPSGDKHDYMSFGPYWWPDPTKPDGLPYVRRDGETNPGSLADSDRPRLERMVDGVVPVVEFDEVEFSGEFCRLGVIAALRSITVARFISGLLIITGAACGRICAVVSIFAAFACRQADDH